MTPPTEEERLIIGQLADHPVMRKYLEYFKIESGISMLESAQLIIEESPEKYRLKVATMAGEVAFANSLLHAADAYAAYKSSLNTNQGE